MLSMVGLFRNVSLEGQSGDRQILSLATVLLLFVGTAVQSESENETENHTNSVAMGGPQSSGYLVFRIVAVPVSAAPSYPMGNGSASVQVQGDTIYVRFQADELSSGVHLMLVLGGAWKAFSATCTHAPCTVQWTGSQIHCPCHDGLFNPTNGGVLSGPPPIPLPEFGVLVQNNSIYVSDGTVN